MGTRGFYPAGRAKFEHAELTVANGIILGRTLFVALLAQYKTFQPNHEITYRPLYITLSSTPTIFCFSLSFTRCRQHVSKLTQHSVDRTVCLSDV
jgi:hypothetical protein